VANVAVVRGFQAFLDSLRVIAETPEMRVSPARLTSLDTTLVAQFRLQEAEGITMRVRPGVDSLAAYLARYVDQAPERPGLWQYPGGKEYYRYLLRRHLGVEIEPEEAHRAALVDLGRVDSMLVALRRRLGWSGVAESALHDSLRRAPAFAPIGVDSVVNEVRSLMAVMRDSLASRVRGLPDALPVVRAATPLERLLDPDGLVRPPEYADSATQVVVTPAWGSRLARLEGASHVFRWTWPGITLATTVAYQQDTPSAIALLHPSEARVVGWGEYAASLAGELGFYAAPMDAYGRLMHEGWNAALLVADTGLHYYGWTPQQALAVMRRFSFADDSTLERLFVERIVQDPGAAGVATVGAREHAAMRTWMQRTLGRAFDQAAWHQAMLALGPVPLPVAASYLEWWGWNVARQADEARRDASKR
jgi:uncharacterized protein (DUF885 family)